jgi:hypothetical protein
MNGEAYDHLLPPRLAVGLERERAAFVAAHGADAAEYVFHPPEWTTLDAPELEYADEHLNALTTPANQILWEKERSHMAMKLVHDVARALNETALSLRTTDDFVVFACDSACGDGFEGVRKAATPAQRKKLARFGL